MHHLSPNLSIPGSPVVRKTGKDVSAEQTFSRYSFTWPSLDSSYECCSVNPLTGSPCTCRRSPRLLRNGYYILTEDSFVLDEDGNLTLIPSQTSISYKERLVRIFRRRRRIRRSLASLFNMTNSSNSWLDSSLFSSVESPLAESSWIEGHENEDNCSYTSKNNLEVPSKHTSWISEDQKTQSSSQHGSTTDLLFGQRAEGLLDPPAQSKFLSQEYSCNNSFRHSQADISRNFCYRMITLTVCLFMSIFARYFLGGSVAALLTFILVFLFICALKTAFTNFVKCDRRKTEARVDISSWFHRATAKGCSRQPTRKNSISRSVPKQEYYRLPESGENKALKS